MNKRIQNKKNQKENKKRMDAIIATIGQVFKVADVQFQDSYYVYPKEKNSICHFRLKETPDWKFGIWLKPNGYDIFGEYEDFIDKFKPSATYISYSNSLDLFVSKIKEIKENPKLYMVDSMTNGDALKAFEKIGDGEDAYYEGYQVIRSQNPKTKFWTVYTRDENMTQEKFVNQKYEKYMISKKEDLEDEEADRALAFSLFQSILNCHPDIEAIGVEDRNKTGVICSPRYDIHVVIKKASSEDKMQEIYQFLDEYIFNESKKGKTYHHHFSLYSVGTWGEALKTCDYRYTKPNFKWK